MVESLQPPDKKVVVSVIASMKRALEAYAGGIPSSLSSAPTFTSLKPLYAFCSYEIRISRKDKETGIVIYDDGFTSIEPYI